MPVPYQHCALCKSALLQPFFRMFQRRILNIKGTDPSALSDHPAEKLGIAAVARRRIDAQIALSDIVFHEILTVFGDLKSFSHLLSPFCVRTRL